MSFFGDILTPLKDAGEAAFDAVTGSSPSSAPASAPVPTVHGGPPRSRPVSSWTAPDASGSGQISVHRDVLRSVARSMQSDLKEVDTAVAAVRAASGDAGSVRGWSTGNAFSGNAANACHAIAQAGTHVGNAQQTASKNVADCAATYDAAESDNQQAISGVGTQSNTVGTWGPTAGANAVPAAPASSSSAMPSIDVKTHGVAESDVAGMTAAEVMDILHSLPSGEVAAAGAAHTRLGSTLEQTAARVTQHAHTLAQSWSGSAAQAAMVRFQGLHDQTATLAQQATQTGAVLSWLGNEVLPKFKALPTPTAASPMATDAQAGAAAGEKVAGPEGAVAGAVGGTIVGAVSGLFGGNAQAQAEANRKAQQYLTALNGHLVQANAALPSPVGSNISMDGGGPGAASPSGGSRSGAGAAAPGSGSGYAGAGTGTGSAPGTGGASGVSRVAPVSGAGGSGAGLSSSPVSGHGGTPSGGSLPPTTGSLQGVPTPGGSPPPSLGTPTGTPPPGPIGVGTGSPPPGFSGLPAPGPVGGGTAGGLGAGDEFSANAVPGGAVPGEGMASVPEASGLPGPSNAVAGQGAMAQGTVADTAVGTPTTSDGLLATGAEGQADYGMTGFPMTGSGAAEQEKERRRKAWLGEDADIWGLPSDYVPPVVEGGD